MVTATRYQRVYDHHLKELVHETGDIELAVRHGVPPSTARGWLRSQRNVVTLEVPEATGKELRQEILLLRRRNEKLRAVLRILVVVLKVSGFSLANHRVPDREGKAPSSAPARYYFQGGACLLPVSTLGVSISVTYSFSKAYPASVVRGDAADPRSSTASAAATRITGARHRL